MSPRPDLGPRPRLGYCEGRIERAAELRADAAAIDALARKPGAGTYVIGGEWIVMKKGSPLHEPLFTLDEANAFSPATETIFLGVLDGVPRFGHGLTPQTAETLKSRSDLHVTDLRSVAVQGLVAQDHLPLIAEAKAVLHWHARHRFCPNCGSATRLVNGGWRRDCPQCKAEHFP
ncbi:MAG: NADH pyrophosphatase zinc ribbon domain-containing protein, partial [Pseudolabrys sp.]